MSQTKSSLRTADAAQDLAEGLQDDAKRILNTTRARAEESLSEVSDQARRAFHRYADATGHYVSEQPFKSVLIAAAAGAAIGALVIGACNRQR